MLKALLPNTFPTANSRAPMRTATSVVTISGNDVVRATNAVPTKVPPKPDRRAN